MRGGPGGIDARRDDVVDHLHGVPVADPYRWLEAGDDPDVRHWVDAQNRRTRELLDSIASREVWHRRLVELMSLPVVQAVQLRGDRVFLLERGAGAEQARLVVRPLVDPGASLTVLADPAGASDDAAVAVDWFVAAPDGERVAYGVSEGGTENSVLHVVRTDDASLEPERIPNCRAASVAWDADGAGFAYTRYPEGDEYHRTVHHHRLGADWRDDPVVWAEHPTPQAWPMVTASPDGRFLLVEVMVGWSRRDHHLLDRDTGRWRTLIGGVDAITTFDFADDSRLVGMTTLDAPRGRIVTVDLDAPPEHPSGWRTVVGERDCVVGKPAPIGDGFVVSAMRTGIDVVERWTFDGEHREVAGPAVSSVVQLAADRDTGEAVAIITGFALPASVWRLDDGDAPALRAIHPVRSTATTPELAVSHVEYPSADGTPIGLFLVHRADVESHSGTPTILNGYGGFAITETPLWSPTIAAWCETGGLYAIAGLRGGFEHGEEWHLAGRRANKQNVFDDFVAAADWLVDTGRTNRDRLAIAGGSNGGLLVGAALTQRPDLCRAVWCAVPLLDMVRFPDFLIARLWTDEFGDPDVAEEFEWLWAYSPYHRVRPGERYPAVLLTTAEGDTRVDPMHARKMAAMLQWATADPVERPVLLHEEQRAGHGVGKPVGKRAAEQADVLAFIGWQLDHEP